MNQDSEQLRILGIFYFVVAGISFLISLIPLIHLTIGIGMITGSLAGGGDPALPIVGWLITIVAGAFISLGIAYSLCMVLAGFSLINRRRYTFCLVMAAISCANFPFGTVLGVFSILVLARESVRESFTGPEGPAPGD